VGTGITSYSTYLPRWRLDRAEAAAAVGEKAKGSRVVASFDEDATTLGVAAAFGTFPAGGTGGTVTNPGALWFATTNPPYIDKTNATTLHAALSLSVDCGAYDLGASVRSAAAALLAAARTSGLAVLADVRGGQPGGADERAGGDGAAAFRFGSQGVIAELLGSASTSAEFLDRWANPGDAGSRAWEERFGEGEYVHLAERAVDDALKSTGTVIGDVAAVAVAGPNARAVRSVGASLRRQAGITAADGDLASLVGNAGTAALGLELADALDRAAPGDLILVVGLADGADALLLRATKALEGARGPAVRDGIAGGATVAYPTYLMWRGHIVREPPRRPDPARPSAPYSSRNAAYKFAFVGGRCRECGTVQLPLPPVCLRCQARDSCDPMSAAGATGRIVTFTVDRLAYSPNPPLVSAIVDLDVGGRVQVEVTDVALEDLAVGLPVRMTFRRLMTVDGIHNYFWKAGPL
jgi:hydroxymethylglutaryl-CoA synthase